MAEPPTAIVIMGAAGAGKTTVGAALADVLGWTFVDADAYHSRANVPKMRSGEGLTDEDRDAWLDAVRRRLRQAAFEGRSLVVACSALKQRYRDVLRGNGLEVRYVSLRADADLLDERLRTRVGHFAGHALLDSQLRDLEPPGAGALTLEASQPPELVLREIRKAWNL